MPRTLTDEIIDFAALDGSPELADTLAPGLRIRFNSRGAHWSVLAYVLAGRRSRIPLGTWPTVSIEQAREAAWRIHRHHGQPIPPDEQTTGPDRAAEAALRTLESLVALYERDRAPRLKRCTQTVRSLRQLLAPLLKRDAVTITRLDISELVRTMRLDAPCHANRCLAYAKAFFNWAVSEGYLEASPAASVAKPTRERPRERTPNISELVDIWNGAERLYYPFGHITQLLILTAARINEIGGMRIDELDLPPDSPEGVWTLPAGRAKNERALRIPLSPAARAIIEDAIEHRGRLVELGWRGAVDGPYLFSRTGQAGVSGWSRAKKRLDDAIQVERVIDAPLAHWRFHDLRRSFATLACDVLHVPPEIADRCLNHVGSATTSTVAQVYARNELFDQRRDALLRWAELLAGAVEEVKIRAATREKRAAGLRRASAASAVAAAARRAAATPKPEAQKPVDAVDQGLPAKASEPPDDDAFDPKSMFLFFGPNAPFADPGPRMTDKELRRYLWTEMATKR
jgi:integrase